MPTSKSILKLEWIFKRAKGVCEKCKNRPATEVHHLTYVRVFNELPSDQPCASLATPKFTGGNPRTTIRCSCPLIFPQPRRRLNLGKRATRLQHW